MYTISKEKQPMVKKGMSGVMKVGSMGLLTASMMGAVSGKPLQAQSKSTASKILKENEFPAVARLLIETAEGSRTCTGVFINDHQMLTAGHCLPFDAEANVYYIGGDARATSSPVLAEAMEVRHHPAYDPALDGGVNAFDLAIIRFPVGTAPAAATLHHRAPRPYEAVTVVGYDSAATVAQSDAWDQALDRAVQMQSGMLSLPSQIKGKRLGSESIVSQAGDQGSGMFLEGRLVGITAGQRARAGAQGRTLGETYYVDLNSEETRAFLDAELD
jgi:hypothetical protein